MPRFVKVILSLLLLLVIVGGPLLYSSQREAYLRNFHVVKQGVLYRSGQLSLPGLKRILHDHGIKTIVTLRGPYGDDDPVPDLDEENYCRKQGYFYYRLSPKPWWDDDGTSPADANVRQFVDVLRDPVHHPVLVHCFAGMHRTGAFCAVYRMEFEGWSNARAIAEMKAMGYRNIDHEWDVRGYLESYTPRGLK